MIMRRKSIFDIIREAEDDNASDTAKAETDQANDEAPAPEESGENKTETDNADDNEYGGDDEFDINADLGEEDMGGGDDTDTGATDTGSDMPSSGSSGGEMAEEEPVKANTDIFASLSKEEQQVKILELKKLFANLYSSTDDILDKINNTETDENNIHVINRISMTIFNLRKYIADYIENSFGYKSYIENDITFNRFLSIINSVSSVLEDIGKENAKNKGKTIKTY